MTNRSSIIDELIEEMGKAREKYPAEHDNEHGLYHLISLADEHSHGFGEAPTEQFVRGELIIAAGLLLAGVELIDRGVERRKSFDRRMGEW